MLTSHQMSLQSIKLYNQLAKKKLFQQKVNFNLQRIKTVLNLLKNPEKKLSNVVGLTSVIKNWTFVEIGGFWTLGAQNWKF